MEGYITTPKLQQMFYLFFNIAKRFKSVTYNNRERDAFKVTRDDGSIIQFIPSKEGLYYYDFNDSIEWSKSHSVMIVESVEQLKRNYNKREIEAAEKARRLYVTMERPSEESFELMIQRGKIVKNPVTITDCRNAIKIYGKDLGAVKGKTVGQKSMPVIVEIDDGPREILNIILSVDIMYLIGMTYLVTVSRGFVFVTATYLSDRKKNTILKAIKQVMALYTGEQNTVEEVEFTEWNNPIHTLLADNEFGALKDEIEAEGTKVNVAAKEEHVPEVE